MPTRRPILDLDHALRALYAAIYDDNAWLDFYEVAIHPLGAAGALLHLNMGDRERHKIPIAIADPHYLNLYGKEYATEDIWLTDGKHKMVPGAVVKGTDIVDQRDLRKTRFYNEFVRPQGHDFIYLGVFDSVGDSRSALTLPAKDRDRFDCRTEDWIVRLLPHLKMVADIKSHLGELTEAVATYQSFADQCPIAALALGRDLTLHACNRQAEDFIRKGHLFDMKGGCLEPKEPLKRLEVLSAVEEVLYSNGAKVKTHSCLINNVRHHIIFAPLEKKSLFAKTRVNVFVVSEKIQSPQLDILRLLFKLSPAEAKLISTLSKGSSLSETATELGISGNTAKTQLKSAFRKTGCRRQSSLLALLSRLPDIDPLQ